MPRRAAALPPPKYMVSASATKQVNGPYLRVPLTSCDERLADQYKMQVARTEKGQMCKYIWLHMVNKGLAITFDPDDHAWYIGAPCQQAADYHIRHCSQSFCPGKLTLAQHWQACQA